MAIIKCTNCGNEIEKKEPTCPKCSHPNKGANHLPGKETVFLLISVFLVLWWLGSSSSSNSGSSSPRSPEPISQDKFITGPSYFGCVDKERHNSLISMIVENDTEAFTKALGKSLSTRACVKLQQGTKVFLQDVELTSGLIKVRPESDDEGYWTVREAIK